MFENIGIWSILSILLFTSIAINFGILMKAGLKKVRLEKPNVWFDNSSRFNENQKLMLKEHQDMIAGTLVFWKNKASLYNRLNLSKIYWGILTPIIFPVLIQFFDKSDVWAVIFMSVLSIWTAILISVAEALKSETKYRGYRQCESDYYDLCRELLDSASRNNEERNLQLKDFFETARRIRRIGRATETDSPISILSYNKLISK